MDTSLERQKREISQGLSLVLDKVPQLIKNNDQALLNNNFEQAIKLATQLYYLNLWQVENANKIADDDKEAIKNKILKKFQRETKKIFLLFKQH